MKCPNCNETEHEPTAKYCHVCGTELRESPEGKPASNNDTIGNLFKSLGETIENSKILYGLGMILAWIIPIVCIYLVAVHSTVHTYDYVDTASEEAWQNRRLDPHKYDYILNGDPEPEPVSGTLVVDSSPQGATIYLDGKKTGLKTPATINKVSEGKHTVSVRSKKIRINNTWYQVGDKTYSILFNLEGERIPIVNYNDDRNNMSYIEQFKRVEIW